MAGNEEIICYRPADGTGCRKGGIPAGAEFCIHCGADVRDALRVLSNGTQVDRYQIRSVLSYNSYSVTYGVVNLDLPSTQLFILKTAAVDTLRREVDILSRFHHAQLPQSIVLNTDGARPYLVLDRGAERSLEHELAARGGTPLDLATAERYARQICEVVAYLHEQPHPLSHGDIRPGSFLLADNISLINFSIAWQDAGVTQKITPSSADSHHGYAAPEQQHNGVHNVSSDIYSLAATLFHLYTGVVPPGAAERAAGQADQTVQQLRPELSVQLSQAIAQAMSLDPTQRQASVRAFCAAMGLPLLSPAPAPAPSLEATQPLPDHRPTVRAIPGRFSTTPLPQTQVKSPNIWPFVMVVLASILLSSALTSLYWDSQAGPETAAVVVPTAAVVVPTAAVVVPTAAGAAPPAVFPVEVESVPSGTGTIEQQVTLADGEIIVGHAARFGNYVDCVAFLVNQPGDYRISYSNGISYRWRNVESAFAEQLLAEQQTILAGYGCATARMQVVRLPQAGNPPNPTPFAPAPREVSSLADGGNGLQERIELAAGDLLVGHAAQFNQYRRCVAFALRGPGTYDIFILNGVYVRWQNVTDAVVDAQIQRQREFLIGYGCREDELQVIRQP